MAGALVDERRGAVACDEVVMQREGQSAELGGRGIDGPPAGLAVPGHIGRLVVLPEGAPVH